jgi:hypothetical protein
VAQKWAHFLPVPTGKSRPWAIRVQRGLDRAGLVMDYIRCGAHQLEGLVQWSKASRVQQNQCAILKIREQSFYSFSSVEFAVVVQINEVAFLLEVPTRFLPSPADEKLIETLEYSKLILAS